MTNNTVLIVPPFVRLDVASLGAHVLQACAKAAGHQVSICYANMIFSNLIGEELYQAISFSSDRWMFGDRVFSRKAYGVPALGRNAHKDLVGYQESILLPTNKYYSLDYNALKKAEAAVDVFLNELNKTNIGTHFKVIGCTTMFQQTSASIAIINHLKSKYPDSMTIIGGANCAGEMAKGIAKLSPHIDFIFAGESESTFINFLDMVNKNQLSKQSITKLTGRIIYGDPCNTLDEIPDLDYDDYFHQLQTHNAYRNHWKIHIPYESSRGCWWGQIKQCTFCSVHEMKYRSKSSEVVLSQLEKINSKYPKLPISFFDDIMPLEYFQNLLPTLKEKIPDISFFIDQKANLSLTKMTVLANAGAYAILPGIESFSSSLLKKMQKGTTAKQNIAALRYARSCQVYMVWFFLYGFPTDTFDEYATQLEIIPLLSHLDPPRFIQEVEFMRHSVFLMDPARFNLKNIQAWKTYEDILPKSCPSDDIAYYFDAEYDSYLKSNPDYLSKIESSIEHWQALWLDSSKVPPCLSITSTNRGYILKDTRSIFNKNIELLITEKMAASALVARPLKDLAPDWEHEWALSQKVCIHLDDYLVPLATAEPELLSFFETKYKYSKHSKLIPVNVAE